MANSTDIFYFIYLGVWTFFSKILEFIHSSGTNNTQLTNNYIKTGINRNKLKVNNSNSSKGFKIHSYYNSADIGVCSSDVIIITEANICLTPGDGLLAPLISFLMVKSRSHGLHHLGGQYHQHHAGGVVCQARNAEYIVSLIIIS